MFQAVVWRDISRMQQHILYAIDVGQERKAGEIFRFEHFINGSRSSKNHNKQHKHGNSVINA